MDIVVSEELKAYIDPLTTEEYEALERSLLAEGCRDALVLWGDLLVDGHNRHAICTKHGLPFKTMQSTRFQSMEDVHLWMIDQHLGRRSLSDFQRGELALRKREIAARRRAEAAQPPKAAEAASPEPGAEPSPATPAAPAPDINPLDTREALARAARLSPSQVAQIEKIQRHAAPEVVAAVKSGEISLSAAATVATLPVEEQVAAASGGKDELKQAAKRVREARRKPMAEEAGMAEGEVAASDIEPTEDVLRERLADLVAENMVLRRRVAQLEAQLAQQAGAGQGAGQSAGAGQAAADSQLPPWEDLPGA